MTESPLHEWPTVHGLRWDSQPQVLILDLSWNGTEIRAYRMAGDGQGSWILEDQSLFLHLSKAALNRLGDSSVYHVQLLSIIQAFVSDPSSLRFPVILGQSQLGGTAIGERKQSFWLRAIGKFFGKLI